MRDKPSGGRRKPASRWVNEAAVAKESAMQRRQQSAAERDFLTAGGTRPAPDRYVNRSVSMRTPTPPAAKPKGPGSKGSSRRKR